MHPDVTLASPCDACGFVADDYRPRDLATSPTWLATMAAQTVDPVADEHCRHPDVVSAREALRETVAGIDPDAADPDLVHAGIHGLRSLGRMLHAVGAGAPSQRGAVAQLNASDGGVPKEPVGVADIGRRGLVGDRQHDRKHHGRPFQAVCLWSTEVIDALVAEGHPIRPGAAGENVTVSGVDWTTLRPGVRLTIGEVSCELSAWATPCRKNDQWFTDRSDRIDHDLHPGWSRVYAWVLEAGTVRTGDEVLVEP